ncbi:MAG TPA: ribbon-helix-helix protein, CopG family [Pseudonocardiaceae bacterium]|nr:ribbon-helix-helix protein, CopG family [Pseudonocardiaceae bacterium]
MTKARFSISVDEEHAERIRAAAARAGQDVST